MRYHRYGYTMKTKSTVMPLSSSHSPNRASLARSGMQNFLEKVEYIYSNLCQVLEGMSATTEAPARNMSAHWCMKTRPLEKAGLH